MHVVLRPINVMLGCDLHNELTPVGVEVPLVPHFVSAPLKGKGLPMTTMTTTVSALGTKVMLRDTDIGNFIDHLPLVPGAFALAPVITALSGSKSYFGPSSVTAKNRPIACALETIVSRNLNCGDPCSAPFNYVLASGTVVCGMTVGDVIGAFVAMAVDMAISAMASAVGGQVSMEFADILTGNCVSALSSWLLQQMSFPGIYAPNLGNVGDLGSLIGHALGSAIDKERGVKSATQANVTLASAFPSPPAPDATKAIYDDPGVEDL